MQHFSTDALILRAVDRGENDKLLTVLAADFGKFYAISKGAHSMKRHELAAGEPFVWSNMEFYERGGVKWVRSATAIETFPGLRYDMDKMFLAAYFCEVAAELSDEREPAGEILPLTLNALYKLSSTEDNARVKGAFEMRAAAVSGFCPELDYCIRCGGAIGGRAYLDVMGGGAVCVPCLRRAAAIAPPPEVDELGQRSVLLPLSYSALRALSFVTHADAKRIFAFELKGKEEMAAFSAAAEKYLLHHLERGFDTLENYKKLQALRCKR